MWQPFINVNQLAPECSLRRIIYEGDGEVITEYRVTYVGDHYFTSESTLHNGQAIRPAENAPVNNKLNDLLNYGLEVWIEK